MPELVTPVHYADPGWGKTLCGQVAAFPTLATPVHSKVTCSACWAGIQSAAGEQSLLEPEGGLSAFDQARRLLDDVLEHPLTDDQAMTLAGLYIELSKAQKLVEDGDRTVPPSSHCSPQNDS